MKKRYILLILILFICPMFLTSCIENGETNNKTANFTVELQNEKIVYKYDNEDTWKILVDYVDVLLTKDQEISEDLFIGEDEIKVFFQNGDLKWSFKGETKKYIICKKEDIPEEYQYISYLSLKKQDFEYTFEEWQNILNGESDVELNYIFTDAENVLYFIIDRAIYQLDDYELYEDYIYPDTETSKYIVDGILTDVLYQEDLHEKISSIDLNVNVQGIITPVMTIYGIDGEEIELPNMSDYIDIRGIKFNGWIDESGKKFDTKVKFGEVAGNVINAEFVIDLENGGFIYYYIGEELVNTEYYYFGEQIKLTSSINKPGYKLLGWYQDLELTKELNDLTFEEEMVLYGKIEKVDGYNLELTDEELYNLEAEIEFWHAMGSNNASVLQMIINNFNKIYPNIKVNLVALGDYDTLRDTIVVRYAHGYEIPTIAQTYPDHVALYQEISIVTNLNPYINNQQFGLTNNQLNDYVEVFLEECRGTDGNLYALPFNKSNEVLYFNATWFEKYGLLEKYNLGTITYVEELGDTIFVANENAHLSWEDIAEISKLYKETESNKEYAFAYDSPDNLFITLTKQWGGEYIKLSESGEALVAFNNPESKTALSWYLEMQNNGYMTIAEKMNQAYTSNLMTQESIIMAVGSMAGSSYYESNNYKLGVLPYPQKESTYETGEDQYVIQQGTNVSLFKTNDAVEELAGWLFIKYLTTWTEGIEISEQPTYIWSLNTGYLPILHSLKNSDIYNEHLMLSEKYSTIVGMQQHDKMFTTIAFAGSNLCRETVEELVHNILLGELSIDEAYELAIKEILEQ